ncbi:MAG: glutathione peroxidase [Gammaproteobacteria bacterium]
MDEIKNIYNFSCRNINGEDISLSAFSGKTILIVNTASKCGFTPQYAGLEDLYKEYSNKDFEILAFPCNQFGGQEPGNEKEISEFCSINFNVTFPIFSKVDVNGASAHPLFKFLASSKPGLLGTEKIKWNFTKFLVDNNGMPVKRYSPKASPESLISDIEKLVGINN